MHVSRIFISEVLNCVSEVSQISVSKQIISKIFWNHWLRKWFWKKKAGDNCPRNNMNRYDLTSLLPQSVFFFLIFFLYYLCCHYLFTERHKILQNFWRLSIILSCDRVVWSSGWEQSREGLLLVGVGDISTTWAKWKKNLKWNEKPGCHLTVMMTSAQFVEKSVFTTKGCSQAYSHPYDQTI